VQKNIPKKAANKMLMKLRLLEHTYDMKFDIYTASDTVFEYLTQGINLLKASAVVVVVAVVVAAVVAVVVGQ